MVFEKVQAILSNQLEVAQDDITLDSSLVDDLKADSLDVVELIMDLEQEFDIEIPDEDLGRVKTVGDIVEYIEEIIG